jgi:hypothetical protein
MLFCIHFIFAQTETEKKIREEMWERPAPEFKTTQVPEKWKNESAVLLALQREYISDYSTRLRGLSAAKIFVQKLNMHFRIKVLDKAAVEDFSEISFNNKTVKTNLFGKASEYRVIGIKVIKPNGTEKEVDLKAAVKTDAGSSKELKIAVPGLESGDILDYFISIRDEDMSMPEFGDEETLDGKYPIVAQSLSFRVHRLLQFQAASLYGAPAFKTLTDSEGTSYILRDLMREKSPDIPWNYVYRTAPQFRYMIRKAGEKPDLKKQAQSIVSYFNNNTTDIGIMVDFMRGNFKKETDTRKIVYELYYMLRNPIYLKAYFNVAQGKPLDVGAAGNMFFYLMSKYLSKNEIDHQMMLVPSRRVGGINTLANLQTCDFVLKVNTKPALYIYRPTPFGLPNEFPEVFEGMEGVSAESRANPGKLPISTSEQNNTTYTIQLSLHPGDNTKLDLKRSVEAGGQNRFYHQYRVVTNYDYLKEYDLPKYQVQSSHLMRDIIKEYNKEKSKYEQRITQDYNDRDTRLTKEVESDFDVKVTGYKLTLKNPGMWDSSPKLIFTDEFTAENLTKKAGPNLILELGRLIEQQTTIKEEQKNRAVDIFMDYPRSFTHEFVLTIPDGYIIEGLENFNSKVENATGGFVSSAVVDGKRLVIKAKKYYLKNFYPAADWASITSFLNASVNFYNAKILLKKA